MAKSSTTWPKFDAFEVFLRGRRALASHGLFPVDLMTLLLMQAPAHHGQKSSPAGGESPSEQLEGRGGARPAPGEAPLGYLGRKRPQKLRPQGPVAGDAQHPARASSPGGRRKGLCSLGVRRVH